MKTDATRTAILALAFAATLAPAAAETQQHIGTWVLSCPGEKPGTGPCLMRFAKRFLDKGGITGDLEIQSQGKALVPVMALRGLSDELLMAASLAGKTEASIQFAGGKPEPLICSVTAAGYICAPAEPAAHILSAQLPTARAVTVRVSVSVSGMSPLPAQQKSLDLSGTQQALARLRPAGPSPVPAAMTPSEPTSPNRLMAMADKALKAAGYPEGIAKFQALMAKYLRK